MHKIAIILIMSVLFPWSAMAKGPKAHPVITFEEITGVLPVLSGVGTADSATDVNRNIIRGVQPAGLPWDVQALRADVMSTGMITLKVEGLLLEGGDGIGTNGNQKVFATLACGAAAPFTLHSTAAAGVVVDPEGDFRITDALVPAPPATCVSPLLLIRNVQGDWVAAGYVVGLEDLSD